MEILPVTELTEVKVAVGYAFHPGLRASARIYEKAAACDAAWLVSLVV